MAFGTTPKDNTAVPLGSVAVPGETGGNLTATEGGPKDGPDSNGNYTAPVSVYLKDGNNVTQGLSTDAAVTGDVTGTISAKLRGLSKLWNDVWDSVNHRIKTDGSGVTQPVSQLASGSVSATLQPAASTTGAGTPLTVLGMTGCSFTVSGTFSGTVTFQGTEDNVNYTSLLCVQSGTNLNTTTATGPGTFECTFTGLQKVQAYISVYVSGSITVTAHATPNAGGVRVTNTNVTLLNGLTIGPSNPVSVQEQAVGYTLAGQAFIATTGTAITATNANLVVCGLSLFNPSTSGKNILLYSIKAVCTGGAIANHLRYTTVDPATTTGFTALPTAYNLKLGSAITSVASLSASPTGIAASVTEGGSLLSVFGLVTNTSFELLDDGGCILLANGSALGVEVNITVPVAAQGFAVTMKWAEY